MGQEAGAAIVGRGGGNALITASFSHEPEPYIPGWLVYLNKEGFRFIDETASYVLMDIVVNSQTDGVCFAVMDHAAFARAEDDLRYKTQEFLIFPTPNWTPSRLAEHLANGKIARANTLEALGEQIGIAPNALAATVGAYNHDVARGMDSHYLKGGAYLQPISQPPFYAVELRAAGVGTTHAGLRIDSEARVIGRNGRQIPGLYSAGECAGGVMMYYAGGGNSLLNCFVYGRVAGRNAAECSRQRRGE
jgi:fumarate reductase flavoprotein subunit